MTWAIARRMALVACGVIALCACDPDPGPECHATYEHVLGLARRHPDQALMERFVTACHASFDPERLRCIRGARTVGEALACKPARKRPS